MAQLKQDEWPSDQEDTTEESQVGLAERDPRGKQDDDAREHGAGLSEETAEDRLLNTDPDSATD